MPKLEPVRPLVLLGTWSTDPGFAEALERRLGGRRVIFIPPPTDEVAATLADVDDWLTHHRHRMAEMDLRPPYLLAGYSFGGVLALEMARGLVSASLGVDYVGLIDTIRPRVRPVKLRDAIPYHLFEAAMLLGRAAQRSYLERELRLRVVRQTPEPILRARRTVLRRPQPTTKTRTFEKPTSPLVRAIQRSYLKYEAGPTTIPVHIYCTDASVERCNGDPSLNWAPFLKGGFDVTPIDGTHTTLFTEPHVDRLAEAVRSHVDAVDGPLTAPTSASPPSP